MLYVYIIWRTNIYLLHTVYTYFKLRFWDVGWFANSWSSEPTEAKIISVFGVVLNADCLPSSSWIWLGRSLDPSMRQKGVGCGFIDGYGQSKGIERSGLLQISVYWVHVKTPSDGNSQHLDIAETTLQRCFFLHQFVWLDIGWNECQDGCAKSAGDLESDQKFSNWPRDLISGYA